MEHSKVKQYTFYYLTLYITGRKTVRTKLGTKIIERGSPSLMPENNNGRSHLMADKKWLLDHTSQVENHQLNPFT